MSRHEVFGNTPDFIRLFGNRLEHRIIFETDNFVVLPSIGQIVEGYLLILPKKHANSMAALDKHLLAELEIVHSEVRQMLARFYSTPIFYEHGVGTTKFGNGCCVDHAHIHAVPVSLQLSFLLCKQFKWAKFSRLEELTQLAAKNDYLFVEDCTGERFLFQASQVPSQFLRYRIAEMIGTPEKGDWALYPGVEELVSTVHRLTCWNDKTKLSDPLLAYERSLGK